MFNKKLIGYSLFLLSLTFSLNVGAQVETQYEEVKKAVYSKYEKILQEQGRGDLI